MKTKKEIAAFFAKNRLFEESEILYEEIIPQLSDYQTFLVGDSDVENFPILMHALDDNTEMFEITQIFIESISLFYYNFKQLFFSIFLENINIIYPHAIKMTNNILSPILYDDNEARELLCNSIEVANKDSVKIFKEIYFQMIEEDTNYYDERITSKLG